MLASTDSSSVTSEASSWARVSPLLASVRRVVSVLSRFVTVGRTAGDSCISGMGEGSEPIGERVCVGGGRTI